MFFFAALVVISVVVFVVVVLTIILVVVFAFVIVAKVPFYHIVMEKSILIRKNDVQKNERKNKQILGKRAETHTMAIAMMAMVIIATAEAFA